MDTWLFVKGLGSVDAAALNECGVVATETEIRVPEAASGVAFPSEFRSLASRTLGKDWSSWREIPTDVGGVMLLAPPIPTPVASPHEVRFVGGGLEGRKWMEGPLHVFADRIGRKLRVSNPHGDTMPVPLQKSRGEGPEGVFSVFFWSAPEDTEKTHIKRLFGCALPCQDARSPSASGVVLDDGDTPYAEVFKNALYVLVDLPHLKTWEEGPKVLGLILDEAAEALAAGDATFASLEETREIRHRSQFIEHALDSVKREARGVSGALAQKAANIERLLIDLDKTSIEMRQNQQRLIDLESPARMEREKSAAEAVWDGLRAVSGGVSFQNGSIELSTHPIVIRFEGKRYEMGQFRVSIRDGGLKIMGDKVVDGKCHPHINNSGVPCLGNIGRMVAELISKRDYTSLYEVVLSFLESVTPGEWYMSISGWDEFSTPEVIGGGHV